MFEPVEPEIAAAEFAAPAAGASEAAPTSFESPSYPNWAPADTAAPEPSTGPEPELKPETVPELATEPEPEPTPEPEPEPTPESAAPAPTPTEQSYFAPPPSDFGTPITPDAPDLGTVWSLDDGDETPASAAPAWGEPAAETPSVPEVEEQSAPATAFDEPAAFEPIAPAPVAPPSPFAPEARDYYRSEPPIDQPEAAEPEAAQPEAAPREPAAAAVYDTSAFVPEPPRVASPIFPGTPAAQFVPTSVPQLSNPDEAQHPWPPAPEASSAPGDQPPPYLGAPAPTVPAADAPPPPGYEAPAFVPSPSQPADDAPQPGSETLSAIQQLEAELERHQRAQEPPFEPVQPVASEPAVAADALAFAETQSFADALPPVPPEVEPAAEPIDPFGGYTAPAVQQAPQFADTAQQEQPVAVSEPVQPSAPAFAEAIQDAPAEIPAEPSLEGTAFDSLFTASAAGDASPSEPDVTPSPFPGFGPPPSLNDAPLDIPAPGASLPPQQDHGIDAPIFLEPHVDAESAAVSAPPAATEPPALVEPPAPTAPTGEPFAQDFSFAPAVNDLPAPPAAEAPAVPEAPAAPEAPEKAPATPAFDQPPPPPFGFETLVTGDGGVPQGAPQPSTWLTPPSTEGAPSAQEVPPTLASPPIETPVPASAPVSAPWLDAPPPPVAGPVVPTPEQLPAPAGAWAAPSEVEEPIPGLAFPVEQTAEAPPPPTEEEPEGKRPFGEGVDRASAIDPGSALLSTSIAAPIFAAGQPPAVGARQRVFSAELAGIEPTPLDYRVGRAARLFWLWFASNSSLVAVVFGGIIFALGLSLRQAIVATLAGVAISFLPLGLGTLAGKRSGQPTMVVSRATYGILGNIVPAIIALVSRVFWAAALIWILGAGSAGILMGAGIGRAADQQRLTLVFALFGFAIALLISYFGYALIARVQLVISIAATALGAGFVSLTARDINFPVALTRGDGPWILAVSGAVLVFSFVGLVWANSGADLARYQRVGSSGATSMLWATFGAALPSFILIAYGALLAASNPRLASHLASNPLDALGSLLPAWYPIPLLAATALSLVSGAVVAIYSAGFAVQAVGLRVQRPAATLLVGALVLVVAVVLALSAVDLTQLLRDFATTAAVPVAAWAGMFGAEMMIRNRRFESTSLLRRGGVYPDVRVANLVALIVIVVVGLGLTSATVPWLGWEGFLFSAAGVPLTSDLAGTDLGVLVALVLGLLFPLVAGVPAIRRQERAERAAE
ncbi:MAG TPA: cytosine permease [Galbitalea sp.]